MAKRESQSAGADGPDSGGIDPSPRLSREILLLYRI